MSFASLAVTRLEGGITNVNVDNIFNSLRQPDPTQYHQYFEDFDYYNAGNWTVSETQAGATQALTDGNGGLILLTNSAANNDVNQIQKVGESFLLTPGKMAFGKFRLKVDDATLAAFAVGLQVANTDGTGAVTDGIYFLKAAAATTIAVRVRKNTSTGATAANLTVAAADDTFVELAFFYDGVDRLYYGANGSVLGYLDASSAYLPDTELSPVITLKNGSGVARSLTADYFFIAQER